MQWSGLGWFWRIYEELTLKKFYWSDGIGLLALFITCVVTFLYYKHLYNASAVPGTEVSIDCMNLDPIDLRFEGSGVIKGAEVVKYELLKIGQSLTKESIKLSNLSDAERFTCNSENDGFA